MRRAVALTVTLWIAAAALVASDRSPPASQPGRGPATKTIQYGGLRLPVPAGWPVYRLDREPGRCVRFDRHAVYLGRPGAEQQCPARVVGRTEALHIEPIPPAFGPGTEARAEIERVLGRTSGGRRGAAPQSMSAAGSALPGGIEREIRLPLHDAGVMVTATYGSDRGTVERALRGSERAPWWPGPAFFSGGPATTATTAATTARTSTAPAATRTAATAGRPVRRRPWTTGRGFDTCTAPSLRAMRAWRRTYRIANIYIGGAARGCSQNHLTRSWVRSVRRMGYRLIPTYVGLQAPCNKRYQDGYTMERPATEGRLSAYDAVRRAKALGIGRRAPIYFDMEAYDSRKTRCREDVLRFLHEWSRGLHRRHYRSGVYSSVASGIMDLGLAKGVTKPKAIWFAHWNRKADVYGDPYIPDTWWHPHRRIKQYRGGHKERHGGVTINIDSNIIDGLVH
ncbi:DUF1906 domain-containing protein [Actinomadura alba]|nr:DUF1906 domain-containing protein [Actinomadura alba]